jgi:Putative peptidoglycan binding domain
VLDLNGADCMRFCITEATSTFVFSKKIEQECLDVSKNTKGLHLICAIEVPAQYVAITQQMVTDLRKVKRTHFSYTHQQLIQKGIILKMLKKRKPIFLKKNEFWATGTFTAYREVSCSDCFFQTIKHLELALQQRGYLFIRPDNHLNQWEYAAIRRFQRRNGLKVGNLSIETLKKLGVGY